MNNFQTMSSGQGMLKDYYGATDQTLDPLSEALKRRRMKLMESRLGVQPSLDSIDLSDVEQDAAQRQRGL
jgi:hypothetical protein